MIAVCNLATFGFNFRSPHLFFHSWGLDIAVATTLPSETFKRENRGTYLDRKNGTNSECVTPSGTFNTRINHPLKNDSSQFSQHKA